MGDVCDLDDLRDGEPLVTEVCVAEELGAGMAPAREDQHGFPGRRSRVLARILEKLLDLRKGEERLPVLLGQDG